MLVTTWSAFCLVCRVGALDLVGFHSSDVAIGKGWVKMKYIFLVIGLLKTVIETTAGFVRPFYRVWWYVQWECHLSGYGSQLQNYTLVILYFVKFRIFLFAAAPFLCTVPFILLRTIPPVLACSSWHLVYKVAKCCTKKFYEKCRATKRYGFYKGRPLEQISSLRKKT